MYLPSHFEETRAEVLHQFIRSHPLGALVTFGADGLNANHVPFEIDPHPAPLGTLRAHVARANPVWRQFSRPVWRQVSRPVWRQFYRAVETLGIVQAPQAH